MFGLRLVRESEGKCLGCKALGEALSLERIRSGMERSEYKRMVDELIVHLGARPIGQGLSPNERPRTQEAAPPVDPFSPYQDRGDPEVDPGGDGRLG